MSMAMIFPGRIGQLDLGRDLWLPEHRVIWQAMTRLHMRSPCLGAGEFMLAMRQEMCALVCRNGVDCGPERWGCDGFRYLQVLSYEAASLKDVGYWMARLERCTEARRLVDLAQEIASKAWRGDVDGAHGVFMRTRLSLVGSVGLDLPV